MPALFSRKARTDVGSERGYRAPRMKLCLTIEVNDDVALHAGQRHEGVKSLLNFSFVCGSLRMST